MRQERAVGAPTAALRACNAQDVGTAVGAVCAGCLVGCVVVVAAVVVVGCRHESYPTDGPGKQARKIGAETRGNAALLRAVGMPQEDAW